MRERTFLPSENHGRHAAQAARPMAASPRPCTTFAAASVLGGEPAPLRELKVPLSREPLARSMSGLHGKGLSTNYGSNSRTL